MPLIAVFSWSQYTTPAALSQADLEGSTHANHIDTTAYQSGEPSWIGETFTFNGGAPDTLDIIDDDGNFEDAYVETGTPQTLATAVTINGVVYPAGAVVENEFSMLDGAGNEVYVVRINGVNVGFGYPVGQEPTVGTTFAGVEARDGAAADGSDGLSSSSEPYIGVVCFAEGTLIQTPDGYVTVENLRAGDEVCTQDNGPQPLIWIHSQSLAEPHFDARDKPIEFKPASLGLAQPALELVVSPQHRVLLSGVDVYRAFGCYEVLAPAKGLTDLPGVRVMAGKRQVCYHHLLLAEHAVLEANGAYAESFYAGANALAMLSEERCLEAQSAIGTRAYGATARRCITVSEARQFAQIRRETLSKTPPANTSTQATKPFLVCA